jgi:hypothetical protein
MQIASPITPERRLLSRPFDWLLIAIERRRVKMQGMWLPQLLTMMIDRRVIGARQRFYRLVERIRAGKYHPRTPATPRPTAIEPAEKPPKPPPKPGHPMFRQFGWMLRLMPGTESGHPHHALKELFEDPELAPILTAAPAAVWRELRPLCFMLGVKRPALLAPPPKPRPPKPRLAKPPKRRKAKRRTLPQAHTSAVLGHWPGSPSAHWPPGVMDRPRKTR